MYERRRSGAGGWEVVDVGAEGSEWAGPRTPRDFLKKKTAKSKNLYGLR